MSGYIDTYPQTQAQWDADQRKFHPNVVAVVTDGANIGRKKWFNGVDVFADLPYVDATGGAGTPGGSNGEVQFNNSGAFGGLDDDELSTFLDGATDPFLRTSAVPSSAGQAFGIPMLFDTATTGDPGALSFAFDSATPGSIAQLRVTVIAPALIDNAPLWSLNNPRRGEVQITHALGLLVVELNGEGALNGTYYEVPCDWISGPLPANNAECRVVYLPGEAGSYRAVMNQSGTDAPVATAPTNSINASLTWNYVDVGTYTLTGQAGSFPDGTRVFATFGDTPGFCIGSRLNDTTIQFYCFDITNTEADIMVKTSVLIELP